MAHIEKINFIFWNLIYNKNRIYKFGKNYTLKYSNYSYYNYFFRILQELQQDYHYLF